MKEILSSLAQLIGICEIRVKKVEQEKAELAGLRATLNAQKSDQDDREKDIKKQEDEIAKKKNILKTMEQAQEIFKENGNEKKRLRIQADDLEVQKSRHDKMVAETTAELARQKEKIAAMNAETERKAKEYRKEVMIDILKKSETK